MKLVEKSFKKLIVIMSAYNEAEKIQEAITNIQSIKAELAKIGLEPFVYVVDDGSVDDTSLLARKAGADRIIKHKVNLRLGAAVRMGMLTGWSLKDSQPGIFAVNRDYLDVFNLPGDYNYTQQILLDAYHQGMRFAHVPVAFRKRTTGESFVSMRYPFKVLPQLLLVVIGIKPMKIFLPIGFLFLLIASIVFSVELVLWIVGKSIKPVVHVYAVLGFMFFGLQTLFFGLLAELIIRINKK